MSQHVTDVSRHVGGCVPTRDRRVPTRDGRVPTRDGRVPTRVGRVPTRDRRVSTRMDLFSSSKGELEGD